MAYYVNMHDTFLSGWGPARNGRSIYCVRCDTLEQAEAIERAAKERSEMRRVTIADKPRRARPGDHVAVKRAADLGGPWLRYWPGEHPRAVTLDVGE
jgi:hypothetical protein